MTAVPATFFVPGVCYSCNTVFPALEAVVGSKLQFVGCAGGQCPTCGSIGTIPDGLYSVTEDLFRLIQSAALTLGDLKLLRDVLQRGQREGSALEEIAGEIRRRVPSAGPLAERLAVPGFLAILIGLLLQVIQSFIGYQSWKHPASPGPPSLDPAKILHDVATAGGQGDKVKGHTIRRSSPKVGPNDPCHCGSGKKYKKCHRGR